MGVYGSHGRRLVTSPVGGYVVAALAGGFVLLSPLALVESVQRGDAIRGAISVLLAAPLLLWMGRDALAENAAIRDFRRWLRATHPLLYAAGLALRLGFVGFVLLAVLVDVRFFGTPWPAAMVGAGLALLLGSMLSVGYSAVARRLVGVGAGQHAPRSRRSNPREKQAAAPRRRG